MNATLRNQYGLMATALDVKPVSRLPYLVSQAETSGPREHTEPAPCHLYPGLCTSIDGEDGDEVDEDGRHIDHAGRTHYVPGMDIPDDPKIWAQFIHLSEGAPRIGFQGDDLTPDQARVKATELRQLADDMDILADQTEIARALHTLREARANADAPYAGVFDLMADSIKGGAVPGAVFERVLELFAQVRAEGAAGA